MKSFRDTCIDFFQNEDIKNDLTALLKSSVNLIYNEVYIYIWFICFYNVFLIFIILANLYLLLSLLKRTNKHPNV
jgi:hypothetical protein